MKDVLFNVDMSCSSCSNAVTTALTSIAGVVKVDTNVTTKQVMVSCDVAASDQALLDALVNWASSVSSDKSVELVYSHTSKTTTTTTAGGAGGATVVVLSTAEEDEVDGIYAVPSSLSVRMTQWALWLGPRVTR